MILPFSLPKLRMNSKLRQNAAVIIFINSQNNSNKTISTILMFYLKNANKKVAFSNVLSALITIL